MRHAIATALALVASVFCTAQEKPKPLTITATAVGQGIQMGKLFNINIYIEDFSTVEERQVLLDALKKGGQDALVSALDKMKPKGRLTTPATVGYSLAYVRTVQTPTGRKLRAVTTRPISFGEARNATRSKSYNISGLEIDFPDDKGTPTGSLILAAKLKVVKENQVEIELYGDKPWKLTNITEHN